jgi:hypothetical protein
MRGQQACGLLLAKAGCPWPRERGLRSLWREAFPQAALGAAHRLAQHWLHQEVDV